MKGGRVYGLAILHAAASPIVRRQGWGAKGCSKRMERSHPVVFGRVEQGALRHVADASAQLGRGAAVLPQGLVQRELIAGSPGEHQQREQQEWQAAYGPRPSILLCSAKSQIFYRFLQSVCSRV